MAVDVESSAEAPAAPLESRPGIFLVGPPNVGKRTILYRLLSVDFNDELNSSSGVLCHGWTISTKYYLADVSIWTAHLDDEFSLGMLPDVDKLAALVMVFDLNDLSSFTALQTWITAVDVQRFDILLCIGNKADLLPGHFAHEEYRRRLLKSGKSSDPHSDDLDYGILESEGSSLLGHEDPSWQISRSCLEWCLDHNIEYVEACASNADFDKCLSLNGDMQGVDRLYAALTAHMWPGMILKSGDRVPESFPREKAESDVSDEEESDYELEYEVLSGCSAELWDDNDASWAAFVDSRASTSYQEGSNSQVDGSVNTKGEQGTSAVTNAGNLSSEFTSPASEVSTDGHQEAGRVSIENISSALNKNHEHHVEEPNKNQTPRSQESCLGTSQIPTGEEHGPDAVEPDELSDGMQLAYDDLEHLMSEIGSMRDNLRLMPDFQRRESAAKLAMKMAAMFGFSSDEEGLE